MSRAFRLAVAIVLFGAAPAAACGAMLSSDEGAELSSFAALLSHDGNSEELVVRIAYSGAADDGDLGWLMPLPSQPQVEEADSDALRAAARISAVPQREDYVPRALPFLCACGGAEDTAGSSVRLGRAVIDDLELVTLGGRAPAVFRWMKDHGFETGHDRQRAVIGSYLDRGWVMVAARVLAGRTPAEGDLTAVRFRFASKEPVYPLALAGADHGGRLDMQLFTITPYRPRSTTYAEKTVLPNPDGYVRAASDGAELRYSAPLSARQRNELDEDVKVPAGAWLSRYEAAWSTSTLSDDLVFGRSPDQSAIEFSALIDDYRKERVPAYAARIAVSYLILLPVVLIAAGCLVIVAGIAGGGFRRREPRPGG